MTTNEAIEIINHTIKADPFNAQLTGMRNWVFAAKVTIKLNESRKSGKISPDRAHKLMVSIAKNKTGSHYLYKSEISYIAKNCGLEAPRVLSDSAFEATKEIIKAYKK